VKAKFFNGSYIKGIENLRLSDLNICVNVWKKNYFSTEQKILKNNLIISCKRKQSRKAAVYALCSLLVFCLEFS